MLLFAEFKTRKKIPKKIILLFVNFKNLILIYYYIFIFKLKENEKYRISLTVYG